MNQILRFWQALRRSPWARQAWLSLYYLLVLAALAAIYGQGNFSAPDFIYQGF